VRIEEIGKEGEQIAREFLAKKDVLFQADWIGKEKGEWRLYEIKHQKIFEPPPFYGHGLPKWQIKARLEFFKDTRVKPFLFIIELGKYGKHKTKGFKTIWIASLIELEMTNYFDTKGPKFRRIYNIEYFEKHFHYWEKQ